jgi:hypothetical protein
LEKKTCLIKLNEQIGSLHPGIYHFYSNGNVYVIRDTINKVTSKEGNLPNDYIQLKHTKLIPWGNIPAWGIGDKYWKKFLKIVNNLPKELSITSDVVEHVSMIVIEGLKPEDKSDVIPSTELRMIYNLIGDDIAKTLATSFSRSISKLETYGINQKLDPFHDKRSKPSLHNATQKLQDYFQRLKEIPITNKDSYQYLDYEITPLRTKMGLYQSQGGTKKPGSGGIDIFCRNTVSKNPVLIEYKSEKDHSLFYALIQILTYASELSTPSQKKRLSHNYIELKNDWVGDHRDKIELCIMFDTPGKQKSEKKKQEIEYVHGICKDLIKSPIISPHIAYISLVEVTRSNDNYSFKKHEK